MPLLTVQGYVLESELLHHKLASVYQKAALVLKQANQRVEPFRGLCTWIFLLVALPEMLHRVVDIHTPVCIVQALAANYQLQAYKKS